MSATDESKNGEANSEGLATCHAIIGHPDKAKFLAIRHNDGWLPPTVMFPPGPIDHRPEMINQGVGRKYGLKTRVLRPLLSAPRYHCVELELAGRPQRRLDAVWVGREEYERFRSARDEGEPDPFEDWIEDRERGEPHPLRPAWAQPGWFDQASHWIHFQLDRLQIQPTGSVEQYRIGRDAVCELRITTSEGTIYFRAGSTRPPAEAPLTAALAERWPRHVLAPQAVDEERNWMLNRDVREQPEKPRDPDSLLPYADALARLQTESTEDLGTWRAHGCPEHGLDYLRSFVRDRERWTGWLRAGGGRLADDEIVRLSGILQGQLELVDRLAGFGLPETLVHPDFREDNLTRVEADPCLLEWSGTVIGHPFFALEPLLRRGAEQSRASRVPGARIREAALAEVRSAYLEPFTQFAAMDRLREAMEIAGRLMTLWAFTRVAENLDWAEPESPRYQTLAVWLQAGARQLIADAGRDRVPVA